MILLKTNRYFPKMSHLESMSLDEKKTSDQEIHPLPEPSSVDETSQEHLQEDHSHDDKQPHFDHPHKQQFEQFLKDLEGQGDAEAKLQFTITFMENSLAQSGIPHFKSFWEARNICLQLFKENINPVTRALLWTKYNELSKEARRLKEILDEQSAFAVEQIEIAIKALEEDIDQFDQHLEKVATAEFPSILCQSLQDKLPAYSQQQRKLNLLNAQASRITAMRKELIRTDMRVRQKNKFFQRLSAAGDKVFPKRKELIKEVSQHFIDDVDAFIKTYFTEVGAQDSLFYLREEIKGFQNMAKILTLNTHSFTHTRMRLSECWDQLKNLEKERKRERAQQKGVHKQNVEEALKRINEFKPSIQEKTLSAAELENQLEEISHFTRGLELGREEISLLRDEFNVIRKMIKEKSRSEEEERRRYDQEKEQGRRQKIQTVRERVENLVMTAEAYDADKLMVERDALLEAINDLSLHKSEKQELERQLKPLRDIITEKRESSLLTLSDDDRQSLQQFKEILKQRKERRNEIKNQIELFRKASGSSGLDFEQAMAHTAQMEAEKERLEKINQGIEEIGQKIAELEKKVL